MKIAVLSDIHSNNIALKACIDEIDKLNIDGICLLGDYVSDCPNPQATLKMLKELSLKYKTWIIKGNREQYFVDHQDGKKDDWAYTSYKGSLLYTYENLTNEDIEFFRRLPSSLIVNIPDMESILLVHGSPKSLKELMNEDQENTKKHMVEMPTKYILCGHTHKQFSYKYQGKILINPGSVGVAIGRRANAHFCILEWKENGWRHEFKSIPYDFEKLCEYFKNSSLPSKSGVWSECIIKSIDAGINLGPLCAKEAYDIAMKEGITLTGTSVPDKYWKIAARKLNIIE